MLLHGPVLLLSCTVVRVILRKTGSRFCAHGFRAFSHRAKTLLLFSAAFSEPLTGDGQLENALDLEVFGLRMQQNQCAGGLFGVQLVFVAHHDAQPVSPQQVQQLGLICQIRAGRIAKGIT